MLEVRLIGKFDINYDGEPITISSRIAQSLFAYLILTAGTLHRREKLAGMFWPDSPEEKARAYLRHELWRIRKALHDKSENGYIFSDDVNVSFDSSSEYGLDVAALNNVSDNAIADELITGLSFYQGELLPGFYEDWVVSEREHLQAAYEKEMARLLELLENEKRWSEILDWAERCISFGQTSEVAYRALMIVYDALGDGAKVVSTYERCVRALRELDLEPSEETHNLAFKRTSALNIPIPVTSFIGREKELKEIVDLFSKSRLITLTGSGGVGKTRLSIQVVADVMELFPDGVWYLDLAPLSDPALVPGTLAGLLGLRDPTDSKLSIINSLKAYLRSRTALLVFDNCEHLIESSSQLIDSLLQGCQNLYILATSREAFRIAGEIRYRVPSLEIPKSDIEFAIDSFAKIESVQLFRERAEFACPSFAVRPQNARVIAEICRRLDGIPLAIELAAARVNVLTTDQILKRLDDRFRLLIAGERTALPRHQTLQAMIDWSYGLLPDQERILLQRLSVFAGGWSLEAAEFVCGSDSIDTYGILDLLTQLLNKSLIVVERKQGQEARYQMLETIRQYALQKSEQDNDLALKHCMYYASFVGARYPAIMTHRQQAIVGELLPEIANLRLAWAYAIQTGRYQELRIMAQILAYFTEFSNRLSEGSFLYMEATRIWDEHPLEDPLARSAFGLCLTYHGYYEWRLGHYEKAMQRLTQSANILRTLNDPLVSFPLTWMGAILAFGGQVPQALQFLDESEQVLINANPETGMWMVEWARGIAYLHQGDLDRAKECLQESVAWCRKTGDPRASSFAMSYLSRAYTARGEFAEAESTALEILTQSRLRNDTFSIGMNLNHLGNIAFAQGDIQKATISMQESLSAFEDNGDTTSYLSTLSSLGDMQLATKQLDDARKSYSRVVNLANEAGILQYLLDGVVGLAEIMLQTGDRKKAVTWLTFVQQSESANPDTKLRAEKTLQDLQVGRTKPVVLSLDDILNDVK